MNKTLRGFVCGMVIITALILPACRTKKKPTAAPPVAETTATTATTDTAAVAVKPPEDFVRTDTAPVVQEETLPSDLDEANRLAHSRGFLQDAFFGYDESALTAQAQAALTASANWLKRNPQYNLLIEGHCDERGTEQYNLALGDRRAHTAKEFLVALGIDAGRIRTVSYGEERPFNPGHDESAWSENRRAHLVLVGR